MFSIDRISELQGRISDIQTKLNLPGTMPGLSFDKHLENAMKSAEANAKPTDASEQIQQSQQTQPQQQNRVQPRVAQNLQTQSNPQNVFNINFESPTITLGEAEIDPQILAGIVSVNPETNRLTIDLDRLKAVANGEIESAEDFVEEEDPNLLELPISNHRIDDLIRDAAEKYGVDPRLVAAVAEAESNGNQYAISSTGAIGVMQLMPGTAAALGVNPYVEAENIEGGAKYLSQMLTTFNGDVRRAVAAYNAGPGAVQRYGGIPPYSETQNYVRRVIDLYE